MPIPLNREEVCTSWEPYVRHIADMLGLRDWKVLVRAGQTESGNHAQVNIPYGRRIANLYLSDEFLGEREESQRQTVVHEMLHLHMDAAGSMVRDSAEDVWPHFLRMHEMGIDSIAEAIAPLYPLPSEIPIEVE